MRRLVLLLVVLLLPAAASAQVVIGQPVFAEWDAWTAAELANTGATRHDIRVTQGATVTVLSTAEGVPGPLQTLHSFQLPPALIAAAGDYTVEARICRPTANDCGPWELVTLRVGYADLPMIRNLRLRAGVTAVSNKQGEELVQSYAYLAFLTRLHPSTINNIQQQYLTWYQQRGYPGTSSPLYREPILAFLGELYPGS